MTMRTTFTLGSPKGLRPSGQRSSFIMVLIRSPRVSTLRARWRAFRRRRLLSIDMVPRPLSLVPGHWQETLMILAATPSDNTGQPENGGRLEKKKPKDENETR